MSTTAPLTPEELVAHGANPSWAEALCARFDSALVRLEPREAWREIATQFLGPTLPFGVHEHLHAWAFSRWDARLGLPPIWSPTSDFARSTNLAICLRELNLADVREFHAWSLEHRAEFWQAMAARIGIRWGQPPKQTLDLSDGVERARWFPGARLNIVESCFQAEESATAIVRQREGEPIREVSYGELRSLMLRVAAGLRRLGVRPGDPIAIDLPMNIEAVAIYLAIIWVGGTVVAIADSLAPVEIETRLRISAARLIFTQDFVPRAEKRLPLYSKLVHVARGCSAIVLGCDRELPVELLRTEDAVFESFLGKAEHAGPPHLAAADDATNLLFSSGTTGDPKSIPWTHATPIKAAADAWLYHNVRAESRLAWPTNLGWMMGPWLIYATLLNRASMALFEGAPAGRAFGQFISRARVTMLGVIPTLVKTWRDSGCMQGLDWSRLELFSSTGECSNPHDMRYLSSLAGYKPIIEYCGGTEIGGAYITSTLLEDNRPSQFSTPAFGLGLLLNDEGREALEGEGLLVPPCVGLSQTLTNQDHHRVYHEGLPSGPQGEVLRRHGDRLERLADGYYRAHGREDDTMNLAGIKVSSVEIERVVNGLAGIAESAAIAVPPALGGPAGLVVHVALQSGYTANEAEWTARLQQAIRSQLNPLFKLQQVVIAPSLPRTASGKLMRRLLRGKK